MVPPQNGSTSAFCAGIDGKRRVGIAHAAFHISVGV
jgi:hypothetical protein